MAPGESVRDQGLIDDVLAWAGARPDLATPVFVFSPAAVRAAAERMRSELGCRISYATKANAHPLMLAEARSVVDEFNVTNVDHLDRLLEAAVEPQRIAFVNPVLTEATIGRVLERGVTRFVVDDARGLDLLKAASGEVRLTLRLRPVDIGESSRSVVRFGNTHAVLRELAVSATGAGMTIEALSFFVGTSGAGMHEALPFRRGIEHLSRLHAALADDGIHVPTINCGGGFPGSRQRFHRDNPRFFGVIAQALSEQFAPDVARLFEPGRFLTEAAMALLASVVADRAIDGRRMVCLDASSYGGLFESSFIEHGGEELAIGIAQRGGTPTTADVLGPIMDSFDVIKRGASLPAMAEGETVVLPNTGAYAWGYTTCTEGIACPPVVKLPRALDVRFATAWYG
ncbi:MAG: ornithine decarboxylase [Thermoleophilaceae bacterium]|nr:ornithine decarboxylase [Thermoleophilaceae bacterium]